MLRPLLRTTVLSTAMFLDPDSVAEAQEGARGTIAGRITDGATQEALPGAVIKVDGTASGAASQRDGTYRIARVPAGRQRITVSYLGYGDATVDVEVAPGASVEKNVELQIAFSDVVEVSDSALDAQARALNQQRSAANITNVVSADQIGRFPDPNAAEAASRIPGVSIARDQGEGRYVLIRGTEARLNAMTINGERIPSPEGDLRQVSLDIVPTDLLGAIEVSKALTPDMDGDAIGGAVNLVTKSASEEPRLQFSLGSGFNDTRSSYDQYAASMTFSRRFAEGKLGVIFSGSSNKSTRGSENFEVEYDDGDLDTLENRRYEFTRQRQGVNAALDYRPGPNSLYTLNGLFNYYKDDEVRRAFTNAVGDNELSRQLRARVEKQKIANVALSGRHFFTRTEVDFRLSFSRASEQDPDSRYSLFLQEDVEFDPNVSPDSIDPDNIQANPLNEDFDAYALDELLQENNYSRDRDLVGSFNAQRFVGGGTDFSGWLKGGVKYRSKNKLRDGGENAFDIEDDVSFADVEKTNVASIIAGRYHPGPFQLPGFAAQASRGLQAEPNPELDAEDFDASEKTAAAYGMTSLQFGPKLNLLGGVRYERTDLDYTGYEVDFDADGEYTGTRPQTGSSDYGLLLPMVHLRYALDPQSNIRAAVTRTLARPNYFDLVPYEIINREDEEIVRGNSTLRPTTSWNVDLMADGISHQSASSARGSSTSASTTTSSTSTPRRSSRATISTSCNPRTVTVPA